MSSLEDGGLRGAIFSKDGEREKLAGNAAEGKLLSPDENGGNSRSHTHRRPTITRGARMLIMLLMTSAFFIVEMAFGYISHSMALIADSFHMLSDVMALGIAYACLKISERSSKKNTFGWVRAEVLGALINGVFLLTLCFSIFIESLTRLVEPKHIHDARNVLIVGIIGLVINLIGMFMFHSHAHGHSHAQQDAPMQYSRRRTHATIDGLESQHLMSSHQDGAMALAQLSEEEQIDADDMFPRDIQLEKDTELGQKRENSTKKKRTLSSQLNMQGVFLHVMSDAIGSVIVILTALASLFFPYYDWLVYMDPALSLAMVGLLVASTFPLVRETALILMQTTPGFIEVNQIEMQLMKVPGVLAVHEFHVWRLVGERIIATVHIRFRDLKAYLDDVDEIRTLFHNNSIHSTTIQPEFSEMDSNLRVNSRACALACPVENCKRMDVTCCKRVNNGSLASLYDRETSLRANNSDASSRGSAPNSKVDYSASQAAIAGQSPRTP